MNAHSYFMNAHSYFMNAHSYFMNAHSYFMNAHSYFMNAYFINVRNNLVFDKKVIRVYTTNYNNGQIKG
jgi:hypothetical protein